MSEEKALLAAILDDPEDDAARLVYADWLDDHGDGDRACFIRTQIEILRFPAGDLRRLDLEETSRALLVRHGDEWAQALPAWARKGRYLFQRGFIEQIEATATQFSQQGTLLCRRVPLRGAVIRAARGRLATLLRCPAVKQLRALELGDSLGDETGLLGQAPSLASLVDLRLFGDWFWPEELRRLVNSSNLVSLRSLDLSGNHAIDASLLPILLQGKIFGQLTALHLRHAPLGADGVQLLAQTEAARNLAVLDLTVTRPGPEGVSALANSPYLAGLTDLKLGYNNVLGREGAHALARSEHLRNLVHLDVQSDNLGDEGVRILAGSSILANLLTLDLSNNGVGTAGVAAIGDSPHLARLTTLNLGSNNFGPAGLDALLQPERLTSLRQLNLCSIRLGLAGARLLARSPVVARLTHLELFNTSLGGEEGLEALLASPHLGNLRYLGLGECDIGDAGAMRLAASKAFPNLTQLDLRGGVTGSTLVEFARSPHWRRLDTLRYTPHHAQEHQRAELRERFGRGFDG